MLFKNWFNIIVPYFQIEYLVNQSNVFFNGMSLWTSRVMLIHSRCADRPAVEVTHVVKRDRMGNVYLPKSLQSTMPPSHHWHELH